MNIRFEKLGWLVAGGLAAFVVASGFEQATTKLGVIDFDKAVTQSDGYKKAIDSVQAAFQQRQDVIRFVTTYPAFTKDQATRFRELSLKATPTPAEAAELTKLKADVQALDTKYRGLQQKDPTKLTPEDKTGLDDYGKRAQLLGDLLQQWRQDFAEDMRSIQDKSNQAIQDTARQAIQQVGKAQAFNLIFTTDIAPFGQNDVTADVLKAMNRK